MPFLSFLCAMLYSGIPESVLYLYPGPGNQWVNIHTSVILRTDRKSGDAPFFNVSDPQGDPVPGDRSLSDDGKTWIYCFQQPLEAGTVFRVRIGLDASQNFEYSFSTCPPAQPDPPLEKKEKQESITVTTGSPVLMPNGVAVPGDFPHVSIAVANPSAEGKLFLNNEWAESPYILILDHTGCPYFYMKTVYSERDFKVQPNGLLTTRCLPVIEGVRRSVFFVYDSTYTVTDTLFAAPGYEADEHELLILENGHYLLIALEFLKMDMRPLFEGAESEAEVGFTHLQEYDSRGRLIFHFDSREKLDIRDIVFANPKSKRFRFPHMNAIDIDADDHILLSCRHLSAVLKIHRQTGEIIWQLGGAKNDFTFINDTFQGFSCQHAIRRSGPNRVLLFDNGNLHHPPASRAVEYELDDDAMTATLIWEYRMDPQYGYSEYMGNAQRLSNGNTLINWAVNELPKATEVRPDGTVVFEMNFKDQYACYRTQMFDWNVPAQRPTLIAEHQPDHVALVFNKFGDPDVDHYRIYFGQSPEKMTLQDTSKLPLKKLYSLENHRTYYFQVAAVSGRGELSPVSNTAFCTLNFVEPGRNLVYNGDFSQGCLFWELIQENEAAVLAGVEAGAILLDIRNGGSEIRDVQFLQHGMAMVQGRQYQFEFDAWSDKSAVVDVGIEKSGESRINYGKTGSVGIGRIKKHFSFDFTVDNPSDYNARVIFNCGGETGKLYLDNVSLVMLDSEENEDPDTGPRGMFRIAAVKPNPFHEFTTLKFFLPARSQVSWSLYNILGQRQLDRKAGFFSPGDCEFQMELTGLGAGVYICRVCAVTGKGFSYSDTIKMLCLH